MPRLRAVRTKEEAEAVPQDQAISVIIDDSEPGLKTESQPLRDVAGDTASQVEAPSTKVQPEVAEPKNEENESLKKRLQELERAEKAAQDLAIARQRELEEMRRQSQGRDAEIAKNQIALFQGRIETVSNALAAATAESETAQRDWEAAATEGDLKKQSDANVRMQRAQARIVQYEDAKANLDGQWEEFQKSHQQQPQQQSTDPIEKAVQGLPEAGKNWLRSHPEYLTDPEKNAEIQHLHHRSIRAGNAAFSPSYFEWVETQLGMRQAPKQDDEEDEIEEQITAKRERSVVSAPVSRESPSLRDGRPITRRITLSPAQREAARNSGISEVEYAKQLIRLEEAKKNGSIQ